MKKEFLDKIIAIQTGLRAPKNQVNKFGGYNYRSCEDILEAVKPLLKSQGLSLLINDEVVMIGDRYYIKATATIFDENEMLQNSALAREPEDKKGSDPSQITGAASSYARKYALNGLLCIDDNKDADATNTHGKEEQPKATITDEDLKRAVASSKKSRTYLALVDKAAKGKSLTEKSTGTVYDPIDYFKKIFKPDDAAMKEFYQLVQEEKSKLPSIQA